MRTIKLFCAFQTFVKATTEYPLGIKTCIIRHLSTGLVLQANGTASKDRVVLQYYSGTKNQLWYELLGQNGYSTYINLATSSPQ